MPRRAFVPAFVYAGMIAALAARSPQTRLPAESSKPVARVTTRVVQVGVIVLDDRGHPVRGIKADEFLLSDSGKSQEIAFFSEASQSSEQETSGALTPHTYTNLLERRTNAPTALTVLLLDGLNTSWSDLANARRQFARFIATQVQPRDRIAIFTLGRELRVLHNFSNDTGELVRTMARLSEDLPAGTTLVGDALPAALLAVAGGNKTANMLPDFERFLLTSSSAERGAVIERRAESTFAAIEAIAKYIARVPGRKNLVWVSAGFPLVLSADSVQHFSSVSQRAVRAINEADIALYPVDARGLPGFFEFVSSADPELKLFTRAQVRRVDRQAFPVNATIEGTMRDLAEKTGGRAFLNSNDITGAIRSAIDDAQNSYTLGFYPSHRKWNGSYHPLKVSVTRKGLHVRHRLGYFAVADSVPIQEERQASMRAALASPIDATDLALTVRIDPQTSPSSKLGFELRLRADEIRFGEKDALYSAVLDLVVAQRDVDGRQLTAESNRIDLRVKRETYERFLREGVSIGCEVNRFSGTRSLKIVIADTASPAIGSLAIPIP